MNKKKFFKKWGLILTFWKTFPTAKGSDLLICWSQASTEAFQNLRINPQILKTPPKTPWVEFIIQLLGEKLKKNLQTKFLRLCYTHKKYILQKKWQKKVNPALSSDVNILHLPIGGSHCQLDDHHRNPNMKNRDHLVGSLTRFKWTCGNVDGAICADVWHCSALLIDHLIVLKLMKQSGGGGGNVLGVGTLR